MPPDEMTVEEARRLGLLGDVRPTTTPTTRPKRQPKRFDDGSPATGHETALGKLPGCIVSSDGRTWHVERIGAPEDRTAPQPDYDAAVVAARNRWPDATRPPGLGRSRRSRSNDTGV